MESQHSIQILWNDDETKSLVEKYWQYLLEVGPGPQQQFKTKRQMWEKIADSFENKSAEQCEERYKTVIRRNNAASASHEHVEFEDELKEIVILETISQMDDSTDGDGEHGSQTNEEFLIEQNNEINMQDTLVEIEPQQQLKTGKVWEKITDSIRNKSAEQGEERYKTVIRRNNATNCKRVEFEDELKEITILKKISRMEDDSREHGDSERVSQKNKRVEQKNEMSIQDTLIKIAAKKEAAKARRHKERMEQARRIENLMEKLIYNQK